MGISLSRCSKPAKVKPAAADPEERKSLRATASEPGHVEKRTDSISHAVSLQYGEPQTNSGSTRPPVERTESEVPRAGSFLISAERAEVRRDNSVSTPRKKKHSFLIRPTMSLLVADPLGPIDNKRGAVKAELISMLNVLTASPSEELSPSFLQPPDDQDEYALFRPSLTERQEEILMESWEILRQDMEKTGSLGFLTLFEAHPEQIHFFDKFRKKDPQSIRHSAAFREHVMLVVTTVDKVFARLREHDKVVLLLHSIGDIHRDFGIRRRDILLFVPFFVNAIKPVLQPWTEDLEQAWTTHMSLLTHVICERLHP